MHSHTARPKFLFVWQLAPWQEATSPTLLSHRQPAQWFVGVPTSQFLALADVIWAEPIVGEDGLTGLLSSYFRVWTGRQLPRQLYDIQCLEGNLQAPWRYLSIAYEERPKWQLADKQNLAHCPTANILLLPVTLSTSTNLLRWHNGRTRIIPWVSICNCK